MADPNDPNEVKPQPEDESAEPTVSPEDASSASSSSAPADSGDDANADDALEAAVAAVKDLRHEVDDGSDDGASRTGANSRETYNGESVDLPEFEPGRAPTATNPIDLLSRVNLNVRIELGRTRMLVEDVLRLNEGSVVELDKLAGDPVDVYVNDRLVAYGEVLVLNDAFSVRINEIVGQTTTPSREDGPSD